MHADQRLGRQRGDEGVALPLRPLAAAIDHQPAGRDRRIPPGFRRLITIAGLVIGDVGTVVIAAVRRVGPAIVERWLDEIDLIPAHRSHFGLPQPPIGVEREAVGVAMTRAPRLGGGAIGGGPGEGSPRRDLRRAGVFGRAGNGRGRRADLARPRIARRRLAVEGQVEDLAERLARVLRRGEALALARAQEQRLAVRREGDRRAILAALAALRVVPQHAHPGQPRPVRRERAACQRQPATAIG